MHPKKRPTRSMSSFKNWERWKVPMRRGKTTTNRRSRRLTTAMTNKNAPQERYLKAKELLTMAATNRWWTQQILIRLSIKAFISQHDAFDHWWLSLAFRRHTLGQTVVEAVVANEDFVVVLLIQVVLHRVYPTGFRIPPVPRRRFRLDQHSLNNSSRRRLRGGKVVILLLLLNFHFQVCRIPATLIHVSNQHNRRFTEIILLTVSFLGCDPINSFCQRKKKQLENNERKEEKRSEPCAQKIFLPVWSTARCPAVFPCVRRGEQRCHVRTVVGNPDQDNSIILTSVKRNRSDA